MSLQTIKDLLPALSHDERKELLEVLVDSFVQGDQHGVARERSLHELRGLGKEIWRDIDVQEYIDRQRDEWDRHS